MRTRQLAVATLALALSLGAAQAVEVHRSATVEGSPQWVWWDIGDFCEIEDWHPVIADCDDWDEDDVTYRTLTTTDGAVIKEQLTEETDGSYSYVILESPLPVANYHATLSVTAGGDGTVIDWWASFDAVGVSDAEAEGLIGGIFQGGLDQIVTDRSDWLP
jgi:hypothetical protein